MQISVAVRWVAVCLWKGDVGRRVKKKGTFFDSLVKKFHKRPDDWLLSVTKTSGFHRHQRVRICCRSREMSACTVWISRVEKRPSISSTISTNVTNRNRGAVSSFSFWCRPSAKRGQNMIAVQQVTKPRPPFSPLSCCLRPGIWILLNTYLHVLNLLRTKYWSLDNS